MRFTWFMSAAMALVMVGCAGRNSEKAIADRYLRLAVALGERDPDSLDFYAGPQSTVAETRTNPPKLNDIEHDANQLQRDLAGSRLPEQRIRFLQKQLQAVQLRTEALQGKMPDFDQESRTYFGVIAPSDTSAAERARIRAEIASLVGGRANNYSAYDAQFAVPATRVPVVMEAALEACRERTLSRVAMPEGEHTEVEYVFHKPWSAFSRYQGNAYSVIQVNLDFPLTVDRILDLACHEGYPGHHVFNTLRDLAVVKQQGQREGMIQLTFSRQSFVSEAAASYAPEMVFDEASRVQLEHDVLFPLAGIKGRDVSRYVHVQRLVEKLHTAEPEIAREYLDGRLEFVRAADALERETLMPHGETILIYLNEYRSYMLTYTLGKDTVEQWVDGKGKRTEQRWERYLSLMRDITAESTIVH